MTSFTPPKIKSLFGVICASLLIPMDGCRPQKSTCQDDTLMLLCETDDSILTALADATKRQQLWSHVASCDGSGDLLERYYSSYPSNSPQDMARYRDSALEVARGQILFECRGQAMKNSIGQLLRAGDTTFAVKAIRLLMKDTGSQKVIGKWLNNARIVKLVQSERDSD